MFLISTEFQKSRSRKQPDKPGKVVFRIAKKAEGDSDWTVRRISSDVFGDKNNVIDANRDRLIPYLRMIYCIIERRDTSDEPYTLDDIVSDFRKAADGDKSMSAVIDKSDEDFPLRGDIVSVGNEFKQDFKFVYPTAHVEKPSLLGYIEGLSYTAKSSGHASKARSYNSLRSSLAKFLDGGIMKIEDVSRRFIEEYAEWLKMTGVSDSTQSFYLRTLRTILNHADSNGFTIVDDGLFKGLNTQVVFKDAAETRVGLSRDELMRLAEIDLSSNREEEIVRDIFMFAFYCRGMELVDVLNLSRRNISDGRLKYNRRLKGLLRSIDLDKSAMAIIKKYSDQSEDTVFPLMKLYKGLQQYSINDVVRRHLLHIGKKIGVERLTFTMNISTWRHLMSQVSLSDILLGTAS